MEREKSPVPAAPSPHGGGATVVAGVQVLPLRLPALPPAMEAVALGLAHSLVAAPVLYAVASPGLIVMSRYWVACVYDVAVALAGLFADVPRWPWLLHDLGFAYSTVRWIVVATVLAGAVSLLTLPLQAGARRRAVTERATLPLYALAGGASLAALVGWSGLLALVMPRMTTPYGLLLVVALLAAGRIALAGRRAGPGRREAREIGRELAVGGATLVAGVVGATAMIAGSMLMAKLAPLAGCFLVAIPGTLGLWFMGLAPVGHLLQAGRRPAREALPAAAPAAQLPAGDA